MSDTKSQRSREGGGGSERAAFAHAANNESNVTNSEWEIETVFPGVAHSKKRQAGRQRQASPTCQQQQCDMGADSHGIIIAARGDTCNKTNGEGKQGRKRLN